MAWLIEKSKYEIYTDGACRANQSDNNVGSWAFIVYLDGIKKGSKSKATFNTTNNVQELTAVLEALRWANKLGESVTIYSDSEYTINSITKWMRGWATKGWKKADGKTIANLEIMQQLYQEYNSSKHTFIKVSGHSGDHKNEEVDNLCNVAMDEYIMNSEHCPLNFHD